MHWHGLAHRGNKHPLYSVWTGMRQRCNDPNCKIYKWYGGRGIRYSNDWDNFANFLADMGERPEGMQLDRIDNNKGYSKDNCRWVSCLENQRNRRSTLFVEYEGETVPLIALCGGQGNRYKMVWRRIQDLGWSVERALNTPTGNNAGKNKQVNS